MDSHLERYRNKGKKKRKITETGWKNNEINTSYHQHISLGIQNIKIRHWKFSLSRRLVTSFSTHLLHEEWTMPDILQVLTRNETVIIINNLAAVWFPLLPAEI
jgi:hypothetical protein